MAKKILLIDDDVEFCEYLKTIALKANLDFHYETSYKSGKKRLKKEIYNGYIFDGYLPDGDGLELYQEFRSQIVDKARFALVTGSYRSAKEFHFLKMELGFDIVLNKPLRVDDVYHLFRILTEDPILTEEELLMEEMAAPYRKSVPHKVLQLETYLLKFEKERENSALVEFRTLIHRIAGTAASFGFGQVTELCRKYDHILLDHIEADDFHGVKIGELKDFLEDLKGAFQFPNWVRSENQEEESEELAAKDLVLLSSNHELQQAVHKLSRNEGLNCEIHSDLSLALYEMDKEVQFPHLLLIDSHLYKEAFAHYSWIRGLKVKERARKTDFILITHGDEEMEQIQEGLDAGIDIMMPKNTSERFTNWFYHYKIFKESEARPCLLLLGASKTFLTFLKKGVDQRKEKVEIVSLQHWKQVLPYSSGGRPVALLIFDNDPLRDFWDDLRSLRADLHSVALQVWIYSELSDPYRELEAIRAGADEFMPSAIPQSLLIEKIYSHLVRKKVYGEMESSHSIHGVLTQSGFIRRALEGLSRARRYNERFALVRLGIRNYDEIFNEDDQLDGMDLMYQIGSRLAGGTRLSDRIGVWKEGEFALVLDSGTVIEASGFLERLLSKVAHELDFVNTSLRLCAGVVSYPEDGSNLKTLFSRSQAALEQAMGAEKGSVVTWTQKNRRTHREERGILLVEPDEELGSMLEFSFRSRGWQVKRVNVGYKALEIVESGFRPIMVLSERILKDMDGIELLNRLRRGGALRVPFIFLSSKATEEDTLMGLGAGAHDYISKPFSLEILIAKVRNHLL